MTECYICGDDTDGRTKFDPREGVAPMAGNSTGEPVCKSCYNLPHMEPQKGDRVRVVGEATAYNARERPWSGWVSRKASDGTLIVQNDDDDKSGEQVDPGMAMVVFDGDEGRAAAFLAAEKLRTYGQVLGAERHGPVVKAWHTGDSINLQNVGNAIDMDLAELGPIRVYKNVPDEVDGDVEIFTNHYVRGLRDPDTDGFGYGMPTHAPRKHGAELKDLAELDLWVLRAAHEAGMDLPKTI